MNTETTKPEPKEPRQMKTGNDLLDELSALLRAVLWPLSVVFWITRETWTAATGMSPRLSQLAWGAVFAAVGLAHITRFGGWWWIPAYLVAAAFLAAAIHTWEDEPDDTVSHPTATAVLMIVVTVWELAAIWRTVVWVTGGPVSVGGVAFILFLVAVGFQQYRGGRRVRFPQPFTSADRESSPVFI